MTEVNYHLADLSEAAVQGLSVTHHPPQTNHQQLRTSWARPDRKTPECMTGSSYATITSTRSYRAEKTPSCVFSSNTFTARQKAKLMHCKKKKKKKYKIRFFVTSFDLQNNYFCESGVPAADSEASTMDTYCYVRRRISPALMG